MGRSLAIIPHGEPLVAQQASRTCGEGGLSLDVGRAGQRVGLVEVTSAASRAGRCVLRQLTCRRPSSTELAGLMLEEAHQV